MTLTLPLGPVLERLKAQCPDFREHGRAAAFARAMQELRLWPALYVIPIREAAAAPSFASTALIQDADLRFAVFLLLRDVRSASGREAETEFETLRQSVLKALIPWAHPDAASAPVHLGGELVSDVAPTGLLVWRDDFSLTFQRRPEDFV